MPISASTTVGDLVTEDPRRSRLLEKFGIDYCCNGHRSLADAASEAGVNLADIADALDIQGPAPTDQQPQAGNNAALAHDIIDTHHAYMWQEMPRLQALVEKVQTVHGDRHPELHRTQMAYIEAVAALEPHMTTEERVVFPAISRLEKAQAPTVIDSLAEPIRELRAEHDAVGDLFKEIRTLTNGYSPPEGACNSYRAMLTGLEEMELDLHEHIHKENNVLFPRVLKLEEQVALG